MAKGRGAADGSPHTSVDQATADPPGQEGPSSRQMTPAAALERHIEWLEYALGAARSEETARARRLERASKKNREKRTARLAEVRDEVAELSALLDGIRDLQARAQDGGADPAAEAKGGRRAL
jgi:hypothetical protein